MQTELHRCLLTFATLFVITATAAAQGSEKTKVDVTGSWALEVQTDAGGTTTPSVTLKQDGEKLATTARRRWAKPTSLGPSKAPA